MLKEQVAEILNDIPCKRYKCDYWDAQGNYCYANSADKNASYNCPMSTAILNLFKVEVDKLTVIEDEEIKNTHPYWWNISDNAVKRVRVVAEAQLQYTKKQLFRAMK